MSIRKALEGVIERLDPGSLIVLAMLNLASLAICAAFISSMWKAVTLEARYYRCTKSYPPSVCGPPCGP